MFAVEIPGYELGECLYDSDQSSVYRARRLSDLRSVILKISSNAALTAGDLARFKNEFEILQSLDSDSVVKSYELLNHDGRSVLVLEDISGISLKQWLTEKQETFAKRLELAVSIVDSVAEMHQAGIVHKDINPQNIVINADTHSCKLIDFALASRMKADAVSLETSTGPQGTLAYMAPEQTGRMQRKVDHRSDLYSLGITFYELFSGKLPHTAADAVEMVHFHLAGKVVPLHEKDAGIPDMVSAVIQKLLAKTPDERYQSAAGLLADLRRCQTEYRASGHIESFEIGEHDVRFHFKLPDKIYGRDVERRTLLATFDHVARGACRMIVIAGASGLGKTALVRDVEESIVASRGMLVAGSFDRSRRDVPFSGLVIALQHLVQQLLAESEDSLAYWRDEILTAVGRNGRVITSVVPDLELVIGIQPPIPELSSNETQNRFNLVFQNFIQVFCKAQHPLVLFLDDMHWADPASLKLLSLILNSASTESLLLVEAFSNDEAASAEAIRDAIRVQKAADVETEVIELAPLSAEQTALLITDTLHSDCQSVSQLADVVWRKTEGNPHFVHVFLEKLHHDNLLAYDPNTRACRIDVDAIEALAMTENVATLMAKRLDDLSEVARRVLSVAAAVGNRFDLATLAAIDMRPIEAIANDLVAAVRNGLVTPFAERDILPLDAIDSPSVHRRYAFSHDRVREAAYAAIPEHDRARIHLTIGRALTEKLAEREESDSRIFDVVNHMNQGKTLIDTQPERDALAEKNYAAGMQAKSSTAYAIAIRYFEHAIDLFAEKGWSDHYRLCLSAHEQLAECLSLMADFDSAFARIDAAAGHIKSMQDDIVLQQVRMTVNLCKGDLQAAVDCVIAASKQFGVELPGDPENIRAEFEREIERVLDKTSRLTNEDLVNLPTMEDKGLAGLLSLWAHAFPAVFQVNQPLFRLICCKLVSYSLQHGNCPSSAKAYGSFSAVLSGGMGRFPDAYRFGKLGVELANRMNDTAVKPNTYYTWGAFASAWNEPVTESIDLMREGLRHALENGDNTHAALHVGCLVGHLQFKGVPLAELREEAEGAARMLSEMGNVTNLELVRPRIQLIKWLQGELEDKPTLDSEDYDEQQARIDMEVRGNLSALGRFHRKRLMHRYFRGDFKDALKIAREAEPYMAYNSGYLAVAEFNFFHSLTLTACYEQQPKKRREEFDQKLERNQRQMQTWSDACPANFGPMHLLVEAERMRLKDDARNALDLYSGSISAAAESGFMYVEALAWELCGRFWASNNRLEFAGVNFDRATKLYEAWGASGKVRQLRRVYGTRGVRKTLSTTSTNTTGTVGALDSDALDMATVVKSAQALSAEIILDRLLAKLIEIILSCVGAQAGSLLLESNGRLLVQASKDIEAGTATVMQGVLIESAERVSKNIVSYVMRTRQPVVLENAAERGQFRKDSHVSATGACSVLCAPIVHKGKSIGALYLENNLVAGAFTTDRLEALNILISQVAVSIENANLYARQEQQRRAIEQANRELKKEVAERKRAEEEISRYRDHLEDLVRERTQELEEAQSRLVEVSRQAGMAEVASGVLHNVGNVMNSINVGATVVREAVVAQPIRNLAKLCKLIESHSDSLDTFFTANDKGRKVPEYLSRVTQKLDTSRSDIMSNLDNLMEHLEHMKNVIAAQQTYAKSSAMVESCCLADLIETSLSINATGLRSRGIEVVRDIEDLPRVMVDKHQILQILVNLVTNAEHAIEERGGDERALRVSLKKVADDRFRITVKDSGIGIARDVLKRIFHHGFTTRKDGHGFGLHNCANAAIRMHGRLDAHSDGPNTGATFTLELPAEFCESAALVA